MGPYYSLSQFLSLNTNLVIAQGDYADTDWQKESIFRSLANSVTFRGEQFTIFGLGQSLKEVRGKFEVTGEASIQAVVERVEKPPTMAGPQVDYRILYYRNLKN
jgi:hypothetical protein